MFSLFKKKDKKEEKLPAGIPAHVLELRKTLYPCPSLDLFLDKLDDAVKNEYPWSIFQDANQALKNNDQPRAIEHLRKITDAPDLETRLHLQAWYTLTGLGVAVPDSLCGTIQGAVTEYHMKEGLDIVAAYRDHTARYWNFSGAGVVWEARDPEIDQKIDDLLEVGQAIMKSIGIKRENPPEVPEKGVIRVYYMAFDGSCFGHGAYENLVKDKMGNYAIGSSYQLMTALMKKQEQQQKKT